MSYKVSKGIAENELKDWLSAAAKKHGTFNDGRVDYTNADIAPIVICTVVYDGKILLAKRGYGLADAEGYWSAINGFIDEPKPVIEIARQELIEELSLEVGLKSIKVGASYALQNPQEKRKYIIFPCLVSLDSRPAIKLDREHTEFTWITRDQLENFKILDDLPYAIDMALKLEDSSKIAINVAMLPPDEVIDKAIAVNQNIQARGPSKPVLGKSKYLPHITLLQAVIDKEDLPKAQEVVDRIASDFSPLDIDVKLNSSNEFSSLMVTCDNSKVHELHLRIMEELKGLVSYDALAEHFAEPIHRPKTIDWVQGFAKDAAYDNFTPHLTLGRGPVKEKVDDFSFTARRLAICHIGDYNTCQKVLFETSL